MGSNLTTVAWPSLDYIKEVSATTDTNVTKPVLSSTLFGSLGISWVLMRLPFSSDP